jgi:hypothetical protein
MSAGRREPSGFWIPTQSQQWTFPTVERDAPGSTGGGVSRPGGVAFPVTLRTAGTSGPGRLSSSHRLGPKQLDVLLLEVSIGACGRSC